MPKTSLSSQTSALQWSPGGPTGDDPSSRGTLARALKAMRRMSPTGLMGWGLLLFVILLVTAPILSLIIIAFGDAGDVWPHLLSTVLPRSVAVTVWLMLGVGTLTAVIGVSTAWLVTMCRFPGDRIFRWALLIPLSIPTYIVAYASVELLDYSGPAQSALRWLFGWASARDYWFPEIRSLPGAILVMSLVLYPYVYLTTRATFLLQSSCALDVSRTLGAGPLRLFVSVALPLARPAIVVGVTLAMMECLNDIGAVEFFGVKTLTFSVYDTWLNRSSLAGAAQISTVMLVVVLLLLWGERHGRRKQRYAVTSRRYQALPSYRLRGRARFSCFHGLSVADPAGLRVACLCVAALGIAQLAGQSQRRFRVGHGQLLAVGLRSGVFHRSHRHDAGLFRPPAQGIRWSMPLPELHPSVMPCPGRFLPSAFSSPWPGSTTGSPPACRTGSASPPASC